MAIPDYEAESSIEHDSVPMNPDDTNYLRKFLTKQMCKILLILFIKTLSNKDLAKQMGISTSALSNILQRMKKSQIQLLITKKEDKYIFYSLTQVACAYVKDNLAEKSDSEAEIIRFSNEKRSNYIECTKSLHKLKKYLPNDTTGEYEKFFESHYVKGNKEEREAWDDFIIKLAKMNNEECAESFHGIVSELDAPVFQGAISHCVSLYQAMTYLTDIYDQEWESAYDFVDSVFESKGEGVSLAFLSKCKSLATEKIAEMGRSLFEIANISKKSNHSKLEFMDCWKVYIPRKQFIRYIAVVYEKQMSS